MTSSPCEQIDIVGVGPAVVALSRPSFPSPAGMIAALQAGRLGAWCTLVSRGAVGGMAATDGPVPVRVLAQAARLCREARHLPRYGIEIGDIALDYERLLQRAHEVVGDVGKYAMLRSELDDAGWPCAGTARFVDPHTIATENGPTLRAEKLISAPGALTGFCRFRARSWWARTETPGRCRACRIPSWSSARAPPAPKSRRYRSTRPPKPRCRGDNHAVRHDGTADHRRAHGRILQGIVDRNSPRILGCHVVGDLAVELAQVAAVAIAAEMTVEQLARLPLSFPTYTNVLGRAVFDAARQLGIPGFWDVPNATAAST